MEKIPNFTITINVVNENIEFRVEKKGFEEPDGILVLEALLHSIRALTNKIAKHEIQN